MDDQSSLSSLPLPVAKTLAKLDEIGGIRAEENAQRGDSRSQLIRERQGLREEQVQNAVKFLLHPSVKDSSTAHHYSFLEKKGLSKAEIEEAFCQVLLSNPEMTLNGACDCIDTIAIKDNTAIGLSQAPLNGKPDCAPHSSSYLKVMEMLERGETPPGIQEVDDKPPNPYQQPSVSRLHPKPKPWETIRTEGSSSRSEIRTYSSASHTESTIKCMTDNKCRKGDDGSIMQEICTPPVSFDLGIETADTVPWWRQKKELKPPSYPKLETVTDSNGVGLKIPFQSGSQVKADAMGLPFHCQESCPSWEPPLISRMVMPAATNYENIEAKDEVKPPLGVHLAPDISQVTDLKDLPSPIGSPTVQNIPLLDQKGESDNVVT